VCAISHLSAALISNILQKRVGRHFKPRPLPRQLVCLGGHGGELKAEQTEIVKEGDLVGRSAPLDGSFKRSVSSG
jgi:hypothetical protein